MELGKESTRKPATSDEKPRMLTMRVRRLVFSPWYIPRDTRLDLVCKSEIQSTLRQHNKVRPQHDDPLVKSRLARTLRYSTSSHRFVSVVEDEGI